MDKEIMYKIYNSLFDSKNQLGIEDLKIYINVEMNWVISYVLNGEKHLICDDIIGYGEEE